MEITIRNGVPVPDNKTGKKQSFHGNVMSSLKKMKNGQSFIITTKESDLTLNQLRSRLGNPVWRMNKKHPQKKFVTRKIKNSIGVWRIK